MAFIVKLAEQNVKISSDSEQLKGFFKDYIVECDNPDFEINWTEDEVWREHNSSTESFSFDYLETLIALRKISEIFPHKNTLLFHGACISYKGKAYLFAAPSGTGKSTHIRLWRKYIGSDVGIVNGDKPFISFHSDHPIIHGTPWAGKEHWEKNCSFPLQNICFIKQGTKNTIRKTSILESLPLLLTQIYMPQEEGAAGKTLSLIDLLIKKVPMYLLECDISEEAVRTSFEQLTESPYPPNN